MPSIPVNSIAYSLHPDGCWMGIPALVIRLMQNPDATESAASALAPLSEWDYEPANEVSLDKMLGKKFHGPSFAYIGISTLANIALTHSRYHVVITGPEPTSYDIDGLVTALISGGCRVQIETTGHIRTDITGAWITLRAHALSDWHGIHPDSVQRADEIMATIRDAADLRRARTMFSKTDRPVWLRPSPTAESGVFRQCVEAAANYRQWRAVKLNAGG